MSIFIRKSLLAGILIGLGGFAFLSVKQSFVGAFVFSIGLISVIILRCNLYTGKVGYIRKVREIPEILCMCAINLLGAVVVGLGTRPMVGELAETVVNNKLTKSDLQTFVSAIICGALIYLAVELYLTIKNILVIIIPVFVFVATGTDHCIANAYYFAAGATINLSVIKYMLLCIVGNAIGSLIISLLQVKRVPIKKIQAELKS